MPNGRFLSTSVRFDRRLNGLSLEAEYVYLKTIPHLDRDGLIWGDPNLLYAEVCPLRPELLTHMPTILEEWITAGLVTRYDGWNDSPVLFFHGFKRNQDGMRYDRERPSQFSAPPGYIRTEGGLRLIVDPFEDDETPESQECGAMPEDCRTNSGALPEDCRTDAGPNPVRSEKREVRSQKGEERREKTDGGGGVLQSSSPPPLVKESSARTSSSRGDRAGAGAGDYTMGRAEYGHHLRSAWDNLAVELIRSYYPDWRGHERYIQRLDDSDLIKLVEWCWSLRNNDDEQIQNYPAIIKTNVRQRSSPLNITRMDYRTISDWLTRLTPEGQTT